MERNKGFSALKKSMALALFALFTLTALAQEKGTIKGVVKNSETGNPLPGATILVVEIQRSATSDKNGAYSLDVPAGTYLVLTTAQGFEATERSVTVAGGQAVNSDFEIRQALAQFGEEIVVIGSRKSRTAVESPVPVDVLGVEEIEQAGATETSKIIQFLAPSFNFSTSTISDGTDIVRPSTLRGLGPDQTLVLLNGKRRHNSALIHVNGSVGRGTAGVDLNSVPASAIERVEVLRDGASAQYGSDAIAGVLNVQLRTSTDKTRVNFNTGETYESDGEHFQASINHGWKIGDRGFFNLTGEYRDRGASNRAGIDRRPQYFTVDGDTNYDPNVVSGGRINENYLDANGNFIGDISSTNLDPREASFDRLNHRYGEADSENVYFFANSSIPVGDSGEFYFFGGVSQREGESGGFYRRANDNRTVRAIYPDGFLPLINTEVDDTSFALGYKTLLGSWNLDTSLTYGDNSFNFTISNSNNVTLGASSPTTADAGTLSFGQLTFNVDMVGSLDWGLSTPATLAFGVEHREDRYEIEAGEQSSWVRGDFNILDGPNAGNVGAPGIQVFPGFRPANEVDEDRTNTAAYVELEANPSEAFLISAAVRFEDYSDFGNNLSWKLAGRYEFSSNFAARGSASTGFRAPSLHQSFFNNVSTQFINIGGEQVPVEVGTYRHGSDVVNAFQIEPLEEETSQNFSLGFTARPNENLQITLDYFSIDIEDRIVVSGRFTRDGLPDQILSQLPDDVTGAQFFLNAIDTETTGLDLVIAYIHRLGGGNNLKVTAAYNHNETEVVGEVQTPALLADRGTTIFNYTERERIESAQPQDAANLGFNLSMGKFVSNLRFNYIGEVTTVESSTPPSSPNYNPDLTKVHGAKWLTDLELSYKVADFVTLALGGNNIFDVYPDELNPAQNFGGIFPYSRRTTPFGFNGGSYYLRLALEF